MLLNRPMIGNLFSSGSGSALLASAALMLGDAAPAMQHAHSRAISAPFVVAEVQRLALPEGQVTGEITAVAIDRRGHLWILHRPKSVAAGQRAAPPVLEFDANGRFVRGFGGPAPGYDWPTVEHSLAVDERGHLWIAGNYRDNPERSDDMVLEFTSSGRFVRQIGGRGTSRGDRDTAAAHAPGDLFVDDAARELYVADGYGNRRVIVFDRDTGAFRRMWSAFGAPPPDEPAPAPRRPDEPFEPATGDGPQGFNGVHAVEVARDGTVYVSDRNNQRIQLFTRAGRYLRQTFVDRNLPSPQTASGVALSTDRGQRFLYVADWGNARVLIYDRATLTLLRVVGDKKGTAPGQFTGPHLLAVDRRGRLYVAEVQGRRIQRLTITDR